MSSSKVVLESDDEKKMAKYSFGCKFHDLKHFKIKFYIFLKIIILLRQKYTKLLKKHHLHVIDHIWKKL
jgi:hypothetical protein